MASIPRHLWLLLILASLILPGGCAREPGIDLELEITRIHLSQGGALLLDLDYSWQRDAGFAIDYQRPMVYVHFLNEEKEIFFQDDHVPPEEVLFGDNGGQRVHYQRCGVLLNTDPELFDNLEQSRIRIRSGFYEKTEMTRKHQVLDTRMKRVARPSALPTVTALETMAPGETEGPTTSLPLLLPSSIIRGPGSREPLAIRLIPRDQLSLIRGHFPTPPGSEKLPGHRSGALGIEMPADTSAEFILRPAVGSRLVFTPLARTRAMFRATLLLPDGGEQTLLERMVTGEEAELSVVLPGPGNQTIGLRLECQGPDPGIWVDARVVEPATGAPPNREMEARLVEIRDAARGWNAMVVILDATRADALSCYGHPWHTTPTLDRIARNSVQFVQSYSSASYTIASTASLFSGLYPATHQVLDWQDRLWEGFPLLAEALSEAGMRTAAITANPCISNTYGMARGFDHFVVVPSVRDERMDSEAVNSCLEELTPQLAAPGGSPFYLYLHYLEPHMPYDPPEPIRGLVTRHSADPGLPATRETIRDPEHARGVERDQLVAHFRDLYHGNLIHVDFQLAKALARLRREGLLDRTLLVITSDHGEAFLEHGRMLHGSTVYREEISVPLLISFPPPLEQLSGLNRQSVDTVDTTAFLLELFGSAGNSLGTSIEGRSYLSALLGYGSPASDLRFQVVALTQPYGCGLFDDTHSLVAGPHGVEFFNRTSDPYELSPDRNSGSLDRKYLFQQLLAHLTTNSWQAPGTSGSGGATVDQALKDQLVALGYVQD